MSLTATAAAQFNTASGSRHAEAMRTTSTAALGAAKRGGSKDRTHKGLHSMTVSSPAVYETCPDCGQLGYSEDAAGGHCWRCDGAEIERLRAAGKVLASLFEDDAAMPGPMPYLSWSPATYAELRHAAAAFEQKAGK